MTNATVAEVVSVEDGQVLKVTHQDGETELVVGPEVPFTRWSQRTGAF